MHISDITDQLEEGVNNPGSVNYIVFREAASIISRVTSIILGVLVVATMILIPIVASIEIMYLAIPLFRGAMDKIIYNTQNSFLKRTIGFTLQDALKAIERAEIKMDDSSSPMYEYLKIKLKYLLIEMIIIAIVVTGGVETLATIIGDAVSGILEVIIANFYM